MDDLATTTWDHVIVGGGAAGCVLAARLSEDPHRRVLLLEAGDDYPPGTEPSEILDIFAATAHSNPRFTWSGLNCAFGPKPSNEKDQRPRRRYTQGRVIGGGSSINGMASNRGLPSDYDAWAEAGATGWDWQGVLPYFRKLETDIDFDGPLHGNDGPMELRRYPAESWPAFTRAVIDAVSDAGYANIKDQNGAFGEGYFPVAYNHTKDRRIGVAWAYLTAEVRRRPNLRVAGNAPVERLLTEGPRVTGVAVRRDGETQSIFAREVIVSCGAIHSPVLLMRNGIGPARELMELGIDVVVDRPGVGKHLMEHPGVNFGCFLRPHARLPGHLRRQMFAALRWSSGMADCPAGDMYIIPTNKASWHAIGHRLGLLMLWVNRSFSTGEIRLLPGPPGGKIDIDFNMCSDRRDLDRLVLGVKLLAKLADHPNVRATVEEIFPVSYSDRARKLALYSRWNDFQTRVGGVLMDGSAAARRLIIKELIADAPSIRDLAADETLAADWIKESTLGHWHVSCTCRMGAADDPMAVTKPDGRVHGVEGLRVADASIFPNVPCANTHIPTIMVAEKIAAAIRNES